MTRADMIKEAILDGLTRQNLTSQAAIISATIFDFDPLRDQVIAFCPRPVRQQNLAATPETVAFLRESIEAGLRINGFVDVVHIEP